MGRRLSGYRTEGGNLYLFEWSSAGGEKVVVEEVLAGIGA